MLGRGRLETPREGGPDAVTDARRRGDGRRAARRGLEAGELAGIGAGVPGAVDEAWAPSPTPGTCRTGSSRTPSPRSSRGAWPTAPVALGNDVDVAIRGEHALGAGRGHDALLGVWWGTGVGGGLVLGGDMWAGRGSPASSGIR